jgi:Bacterial Ig-like domain
MATPGLRSRATLGVLAAAISAMGMSSAATADVVSPPNGVIVTVGVNDSFISAEGLPAPLLPPGDVVAEVWRVGIRVGVTVPATPTGGLVEFNHDPGSCFQGVTPDLRPGDQIRILDAALPQNGYSTTVHALTSGAPAAIGPGTVVTQGTAATASGVPLPIGELDVLIRDANALLLQAPGNGSIAFTPAGSPSWTATFAGLSASDVSLAVAAPRVEFAWLRGNEAQVFAVGAPAGPSVNCAATAPRAEPPGTPDLQATDDTGLSSIDNVTSTSRPAFTGTALSPAALDVGDQVTLVDTTSGTPVTIGGPVTVGVDGRYALAPDASLIDGTHEIRVLQTFQGQDLPSGLVSVRVDTQAPPAPTLLGSTPASGSNDNAPRLRGTAEAGGTVTVYSSPGCAGGPVVSGSAAAFAGTGLSVAVSDNSTTSFSARLADAAGNISPCSSPISYQENSPVATNATTAAVNAARPAVVSSGSLDPRSVGPFTLITRGSRVVRRSEVVLRLACRGLPTDLCVGRIELRARIPASRGARARVAAIGRKSFAIRGGRDTSVVVPLNGAGRALLAFSRARSVRVTAGVVVRSGVIVARRTGIPLTLSLPR